MSTSAPAFSSNNPFRRQQYQTLTVDRQPSPSFASGSTPPRRSSPAIPPRRPSNTSQSYDDFDFDDGPSYRNGASVRRDYQNLKPNQPLSSSSSTSPSNSHQYLKPSNPNLSHSHSAQSVSLRDYPENPRKLSVPSNSHSHNLTRPVSSFYSNAKYSNSDQSLFHSHEPEVYEFSQKKSTPTNDGSMKKNNLRLPTRKSNNPFMDDDEEDEDNDNSFRVVPRTSTSAHSKSRPATTFFEGETPSKNNASIRFDNQDRRRENRYATKDDFRDHPRVIRRTNSDDSIFAPFHPVEHKNDRRASPPSYSSRPSNYKPAPIPPPMRPRHHRANSDSSVMEPQFRRPPPNPAKDYARRDLNRYDSDDKYARRSGKSSHYKNSKSYDSESSEEDDNNDRKYRSSSRKGPSTSSSSHRHHHSSSDRHRSDKPSSSSHRHRSSKDKEKDKKSSSSSSRRKAAHLDTIDRLDVTGFFGPGSFHHDGPFDACTPHRNKNSKKAPVAAFPINGANNSLAPNVNRDRFTTESNILMQGDSPAYQDFSAIGNTANGGGSGYPARNNIANRSENNVTFDPLSKSDPVHGDPTMGLGSSTFLEGTPASKTAVETAAAQQAAQVNVSRKKSLVNKLRGQGSSPAPPRPPRLNYDQGQQSPLLPVGSASSDVNRERSNSSGALLSSPTAGKSFYDSAANKDRTASPDGNGWNTHATAHDDYNNSRGYNHSYHSSVGAPASSNNPPPPPQPSSSSKSSGLLRRVKSLKTPSRRST